MPQVGARELKQNANEILRRVREEKESFLVTYRGRVVARLEPVEDQPEVDNRASAVWTAMDRLAADIGEEWPREVSAVEAVAEQRREL